MPTNTLVRRFIETLGIKKRPIKDYFCLRRGAAVITGLAYTQWFVDVAVVDILITYFTKNWEKDNVIPFALLLVNLLGGLSSVLEFPMTYISYNHVSPRKVILYSVAAYIIGMVMLGISAFQPIPGDKGGVYLAATVLLISVGKAGGLPILEGFLVCQLRAYEPRRLVIDEGRVQARKIVWWITTKSLDEATTTPEIPRGASLEENTNNGPTPTISPEIPCGASPEENTNTGPTPAVSPEISRGASPEKITNNNPALAVSPEMPRRASSEENTYNGPNRAVSLEISHGASPEENTNNGPTSAVSAGRRLMEKWKPLFIMIPMWTSFLIFGLVLSTGYSFYTEQGSTMEPTVSIYIIIMIWKMTKYTSSFFSTLSLRTRKTKGITVGIWIAMLVSVICCYVAWRVEICRLHAIVEGGFCVDQDYYVPLSDDQDYYVIYVPLSIMHLAPQFCLLGLTEGIGRNGLELFFEDQVSDVPMKIYGSALNEAVIGLGSFLSAILVFRFKSWFSDTLNCSRLDKYYQMLMILSFVNLCYYTGFVSIYYSNKNKTKDDLQVEAAGAGVVLVSSLLIPLSLDEATTTPEIPRGASLEENTNNGPTPTISPEIPCGASPEENTNTGPTPAVSPEISRGASPEKITNNNPALAVSPEMPRRASSEENTYNGPNRAVSLEISHGASPEENTNNGPTSAVSAGRRLMEKWKPLFIMIPMWTSFLIFGLVLSTGYSFYTEQGSTMEPTVSIYIIIMIWKMTKYTSSFFSTLSLRTRKTKGITVGIWIAMLVSVICCYVAWRVEICRLHAIVEGGFCVDQDYYVPLSDDQDYYVIYVPLSIMHLAPQFCLLGLTEGIGRNGLELFFEDQVSDVPMKIYGSALNEAVIGLGSFLSAILVFRFKSWFSDTLNCSRLDKYYQMLMILSFVNLCYYTGFVSIYYSNKNKTKDDLQVEAAGADAVNGTPPSAPTILLCLAYTQWFVGYAVVGVLITYFTDTWKEHNLPNAVAMINLLEGSSSVLVLVMTYISDNHVSPLKVILCSTAAYIIISPLVVLFLAIPGFYVLLIAVGKAGGVPVLEGFLVDQLTAHEPKKLLDIDEGRVNARKNVWWITASLLCGFSTPWIFGHVHAGWLVTSVDKVATTSEISRASREENANNGPTPAVSAGRRVLMEKWKPLSVMIRMWTTFLVFGLVLSTGDTFFTEQGNNMHATVSIYRLIMIRNIIKDTLGSSFFTLLFKYIPKPLKTKSITVGILTAMMISVFCCSVAWRVEVRRLRAIEDSKFCVKFNQDDHAVVPMSILRLAPQFCLLGLMEGIGKRGLDHFFEVQVPHDVPLKKYGSALNAAVIGFGSFLNALLVYSLKSWFGDSLNCSRPPSDEWMLKPLAELDSVEPETDQSSQESEESVNKPKYSIADCASLWKDLVTVI
ncbi:hypothetical protein RHSIM_Rhsim07G0238400 [Rhododendron simsii]|uniref:Uncharacterized protein n=1 Tax=Rhododendron simsii TaxID=118357 RepID=A0A834LLS1_RHOSS|nr:hypothetical protein RHSIM_Rhsim07G0238400 [Rhododendron simsii]